LPFARERAFFAIALTFGGTRMTYVLVPTLPSFSIGTIMAGRGPHVVLIAVGVRTAGM